jgi:3-oxoacyl-[acyl-carrier protein] reductase
MFGFAEKVVFITGAGGALGRAMARQYAALGAKLCLTDLAAGGLEELALALTDECQSENIMTISLDVADSDAVRHSVRACVERFGHVDILVANAGVFPRKSFVEITDEEWRRTFVINVDGVFYCCREAVRYMPPGSCIVSLASIAAHRGSRDHVHYAATKGALLSMMRSLAWELAPHIRVNCVSPGPVDSPMVSDLMLHRGESIVRQTPLGRLATPDEVARTVVFVTSDWASHITGAAIHVNGGSYIAG